MFALYACSSDIHSDAPGDSESIRLHRKLNVQWLHAPITCGGVSTLPTLVQGCALPKCHAFDGPRKVTGCPIQEGDDLVLGA